MSLSGEKEKSGTTKRSLSGDREEGGTASKMSLCGELDSTNVTESPIQKERPVSPVPSCLSLKSDKSMGHPIEFQRRDVSTDHKIQMERPDSSTPSCVSMQSVKSIGHPIEFRDITIRQRDQKERSESEVPSGQSAPSHQTDLSSIFRLVEKNAIALVKRELKKFKKILCPDLPECFESQTKDKELVDAEDVEQESIPREGALKITLHILRKINQKELADTLENSKGILASFLKGEVHPKILLDHL